MNSVDVIFVAATSVAFLWLVLPYIPLDVIFVAVISVVVICLVLP